MTAYRKMLRAKIHRATVTHADVDYEGSISLSPELLEAADLREYEAVQVWNVTRGTRFETYAITGIRGTTDISVNGAAAHLVEVGDKVIVAAFIDMEEEHCSSFRPKLIFVDENNRQIKGRLKEVPGPQLRVGH